MTAAFSPTRDSRADCSNPRRCSHAACSATPTAAASPLAPAGPLHVEFATLAHETTHVLLHLPGNGGTPDTLDASLERIRATAQRLSTELDAIRFDAENDPRTV